MIFPLYFQAVPSVMCGTFKNFTHESNLWISNGGTRSVVHYDADHNLHCMLAGRKDFMMMNNNVTTKRNLYFKGKVSNLIHWYSIFNIYQNINTYSYFILDPGFT